MATPVLNNGIFVRDTNFDEIGSHFDEAHLKNISPQSPDDLGVVDLWAMAQKKEYPLYTMSSFGDKNTKYVDSKTFTWRTPIQGQKPHILDDIIPADIEKPGYGGMPFQIFLNKRSFGHGAVLTYDKYVGKEFIVTNDPIQPSGEGFIYTVKLINNKNSDYVDRKFLQANTVISRATSVRDEHAEQWDFCKRH